MGSENKPLQINFWVFYFLLFLHMVSFCIVSTLYYKRVSFPVSSSHETFKDSSPPSPRLLPPPKSNAEAAGAGFHGASKVTGMSLEKQGVYLIHNMSDTELLRKVSTPIPQIFVPKVAFLFLTPGPLPLAQLWELFFLGHEGRYSIYIHPNPSYKDTWPPNSVFYNRRIPSKSVSWGETSMIDAERRLLASALLDISNQRFVLLSDSCIPVFDFITIYDYLINSTQSFVASQDDPRETGRGRYSPNMMPHITVEQWRKGSQWFEVHRDLAVLIVSDRKYYNIFREHCREPCLCEEHYLPTLVNILHPEMNTNRTVTWVDWSQGGPHPTTYGRRNVTSELKRIRKHADCTHNGKEHATCFLFARKFLPDTIEPLI
ncbi:OLC1v1010724C1 [Oldenlandia corymbosa var. corymbosa]|uniref:OLC1v1010724C1 n=1 Tax=Oldenlandia corymbosa var. corymbosa TaxID=529605 RepID=A0AAV1DS03_OLDCO|nr:OLC1v1010724C1 [Oldenlandia corymbosa var. corymbosa]